MPEAEICFLTAAELVRRIRGKDLSAREVMEAHLAQIERVNPKVNAIVTLLPERAMEQARCADEALARGEEIGPLHGLPVAHKDLVPTKDIRTTYGSRIFKDYLPDHDGLIVERLRKAGALTIGKTNTPEFGAGSQTFNEVFGATLNPYDTGKTCGGRPWRWPAACFPSPMAVTPAARCATRRISAMSWAFVPLQGGCPCGRRPSAGGRFPSRAPWLAQCRIRR